MTGYLGFQMLLSGTCEEPLFRGMVMVVLARYMKGMHQIGKWEIPTTGIIATVLFMLAHIGFTLSPFAITHFSVLQQFTALGLGVYYAVSFHRTGSLLCPILSHNFANVVIVGVRYVMVYL